MTPYYIGKDYCLNGIWYLISLFEIITYMKHSQLSNFQKQQYTNYLETQLQKFSQFMLTQKKDNEKYNILKDAIAYQSSAISQINSKLSLLQMYQRQHNEQLEHVTKRVGKMEDMQERVRRVEDRRRFGCDDIQKGNDNNGQLTEGLKECMKRIKKQQEEIDYWSNTISQLRKKQTVKLQADDRVSQVSRKDLKKLQAKIMRYFEEQQMQCKSKQGKKDKSPSPQVSQLSIIDNYQINQNSKTVSSFRVEESFRPKYSKTKEHSLNDKSQISTVLHQSHSTNHQQYLRSKKSERNIKDKQNKRSKSKGKSKSKSKSKSNKGKDKGTSRSISKNKQDKILDKSLSLSDHSILKSSLSKSKSKNSKRSKRKIKEQKAHSNSHQRCKKRPQLVLKLQKGTKKGRVSINKRR